MKYFLLPLPFLALLAGCVISPAGLDKAELPPAIQGSNDVQGNPISVPGAGMGVGAGVPDGP
jgi:hypothetical protein